MKELDLALTILNDDLDNDVYFADALRKVFTAEVDLRPLRPNVAGLLGCELRHHLLFTYLLNPFTDLTVEEKRIVMLGLANNYFFRHFEAEEMKEAVKEKIGEEHFALVLPLFEKVGQVDTFIPEHIERASNLYISLRYNIPEWCLKIFQKEGNGAAYRAVRAISRPYVNFVRATRKIDPASLGEDFEATSIPDIYAYRGKTPLRKNEDYRSGKLFDERPYVKMVFDKMKTGECENVLLYSSQPYPEWEKELLESMSIHANINIAVSDLDAKSSIQTEIRKRNLKNVNLFAAPNPDEMVSAISHPCELVVVAPECSTFDRIASSPDYLLHFNRESMNAVYAKQPKALMGCAKHVGVGGRMVYALPTISQKEGHRVVSEFLRTNPEFSIDEEKQIMPNEALGVCFYYAILYKGEKAQVTDNAPITEIIQNPAQTVSSAKAE
ncbi:MAG: hypothetical protein K6B65_06870 [Bacilli bacterium]|nr:hypothetical protein [Bacilli bacterium]